MNDNEKPKRKSAKKQPYSSLDSLSLEADFLDRQAAENTLYNRPKFGISNDETELELGKRLQEARETLMTYADFQRVRSFVKCNETEEYDGEVTQNALQSRI